MASEGTQFEKELRFEPQAENSNASEPLPIAVATHFFQQRYLFAFATQAEILQYVRTQSVSEEAARLPEILAAWRDIQPRVNALTVQEAGLPDTIQLTGLAPQYQAKLDAIAGDKLFQKTFALLPVAFGLVEVDKLVAPQRTVNLDYVNRLIAKYPEKPAMDDLLEICVSPKREMEAIQHLEVAPNTHVFTSPNSDIRFLGAFVKRLTNDDYDHAVSGGLPAAAVISFIGYGGAPINVLLSGPRIVLNNGFHRVYALRSMGINHIPVVIQQVRNPQLEFPPIVAGLPREYLLGAPRPVLMKDFFEEGFTTILKVRERLKMVTVAIGGNQHEIPA
jgi:hypothetical protein